MDWHPIALNKEALRREPGKTTKMASGENLSMAGELLSLLSPYPYHSCVSNLHCSDSVQLTKFNRDRLPANHWVDTKRFVTSTNRVLPGALFELFGEYSSESSTVVRDNLVGWTYDNYREIKTATNVALTQRKIELKEWIQEMADEKTPGDEIALYILCKMYRRHAFVYTRKWWWTTLLYKMPSSAEELIKKCDKTLVFIKHGVFGEIKAIRIPDIKHTAPSTSTDKKEGGDNKVKPTTSTSSDGPSKRASRSRIRKSPQKCATVDYKKLAGEDAHEDQKSPSKKRRKGVNLRKPSSARIAAQRKILDARLRSPPRPTRVTEPIPCTSTTTPETTKTITKPATEAETREVISALLTLGQDQMDYTTDKTIPAQQEHSVANEASNEQLDQESVQPPIEANVVVKNTPATDVEEKVIGTAIKTILEDGETTNQPPAPQPPAPQPTQSKKGTVTFKSYRLKKSKKDLKLRCRVCLVSIPSVREYNKHYLDKHPPTPCPYCNKRFISPRTLARHLYVHKEIMYECKTCEKGFSFASQHRAHNRKHSKDTGFVCMKSGCGKRFKRDNELNAHVKTHRKTAIKCGEKGCSYSNKDIRNVRAHRKCHSNQLPYSCPLCGKKFRWQQQKKRHLPVCPELK